MGRTKLTQEQKDLIAVLPSAITKSEIYQKLTDAQRLVLSQIDLQDGTDFSAENGYIYTTNEELMKNTGIASNRTVIDAVRRLVNEGLITSKRGFRNKEGREASEYVLTDTYYKLCERENPHKELHYMGCNKKNVGCNCSSYYTEEINNQIEVMQQKINELTQRVQELESLVGCNKEKSYYTTDTETDIETEIETDEIIHESILHELEDNFENSMNDMNIDERFITENDRDAWEVLSVSDDFDYTQYTDIAEMVKRDAGNKELSDFDKMNKWCSWAYNELEHLIQVLYESWEPSNVLSYAEKINSIFDKVDERINHGWFTKKQIAKFDGMVNNFNAILRKKAELMDGDGK